MSASPAVLSPPQSPQLMAASVPDIEPFPEEKQSSDERSETCIIFDWDDTLLASSTLTMAGYRLDVPCEFPNDLAEQLKALEEAIASVVQEAMKHGTVYVITNAETGWVQLSAQKFLPGLVPLLSQLNILSARSTFESMFPNCPASWKSHAFQYKVKQCFQDTHLSVKKHVLSLGDSYVEREAVHFVTRQIPNARTKSVKFVERPTIEQLRRQLELVHSCFTHIANYDGDLDLDLALTFPN